MKNDTQQTELLDALKNLEAAVDLWFSNSGYLCMCLDELKEAENPETKAEVYRLQALVGRSIEARRGIAKAEGRA